LEVSSWIVLLTYIDTVKLYMGLLHFSNISVTNAVGRSPKKTRQQPQLRR